MAYDEKITDEPRKELHQALKRFEQLRRKASDDLKAVRSYYSHIRAIEYLTILYEGEYRGSSIQIKSNLLPFLVQRSWMKSMYNTRKPRN
jgi:hypothetical protein